MAYKSLYRTYRPQTFQEVIGQQHIVTTLKNAIARDQLAHAYLFTGPRGTGKTTIAKLLAKGLNCLNPDQAPCNQCEVCVSISHENHPDIIEIDAASNTGVDDVRDLIERVKYSPIEARKKVYIIDEVHMLSTGAFNALLKTLEEPPEHVVFILATTEVHKVLPTIISRCQRYDFTRVSTQDISKNLTRVIESEKLAVEDGVIDIISSLADGGHRDSLTILEQLIAYSAHPIKVQEIYDLYRLSTPENKKELLEAIIKQDLMSALENIKDLESKSVDYVRYIFDFVSLGKDILTYSLSKDETLISEVNIKVVKEIVPYQAQELIVKLINEMINIAQEARFNGQYQSYLEVAILNLIQPIQQVEDIIVTEKKAVEKVDIVVEEKKIVEKEVKKKKEFESQKDVTTNKEQQTVEIDQPSVEIQDNQLIQLMQLGDRDQRAKDTDKWEIKNTLLRKPRYRRLNNLIKDSLIGVSRIDFIVLITNSIPIASELQNETNIDLLYELLEELNLFKKVFITDANHFEQVKDQFLEMYKTKTLPDPNSINMDFSPPTRSVDSTPVVDTQALLEETFENLRIEE